jgi:hypothetical protein
MNGRISVGALALSLAIVCAIVMFLLGITSHFQIGIRMVEIMSSVCVGFKPGFFGSLIGAMWGFLMGLVEGFLIAVFYNMFRSKKDE